ncbi:MAG: type IX secretion system outer membrane channel protein PorV, partial [Bacteroidota bacterium]
NEFEVALAYSRQLIPDRLAVGLTGKFIYSNLAAGQVVGGENVTAGTAGAADLSLTYNTPIELASGDSDLSVGLVLSNIGTKITYTNSINKDYIPANLGIGAAWKFDFDEFNSFTVAADINKLLVPTPCIENCDTDANGVLDYKELGVVSSVFTSFGDAPNGFSEELSELMYSFGLEYWYDEQFAVRAGYYGEAATKGNRKYFTVGLGIKYNIFGLNFSYLVPINQQRNPLDNTLRFSLLFDFAAFEPDAG